MQSTIRSVIRNATKADAPTSTWLPLGPCEDLGSRLLFNEENGPDRRAFTALSKSEPFAN